jgi:hypothetical protein
MPTSIADLVRKLAALEDEYKAARLARSQADDRYVSASDALSALIKDGGQWGVGASTPTRYLQVDGQIFRIDWLGNDVAEVAVSRIDVEVAR